MLHSFLVVAWHPYWPSTIHPLWISILEKTIPTTFLIEKLDFENKRFELALHFFFFFFLFFCFFAFLLFCLLRPPPRLRTQWRSMPPIESTISPFIQKRRPQQQLAPLLCGSTLRPLQLSVTHISNYTSSCPHLWKSCLITSNCLLISGPKSLFTHSRSTPGFSGFFFEIDKINHLSFL